MVNFQQILKDTFVKPFVDSWAFFVFGKREFGLMFFVMIAEIYFMQGFRGYAFGDGILFERKFFLKYVNRYHLVLSIRLQTRPRSRAIRSIHDNDYIEH